MSGGPAPLGRGVLVARGADAAGQGRQAIRAPAAFHHISPCQPPCLSIYPALQDIRFMAFGLLRRYHPRAYQVRASLPDYLPALTRLTSALT